MLTNCVIETMLKRKSIRSYTAEMPSNEVIETVVRAGQQAPFAFQYGSLLLTKDMENNPFQAPLLFTICVDSHRMEAIMASRNWKIKMNDLSLLVFGIQDATLMAENMVIAAESLGMGSCFLGAAPYHAKEIIQQYHLPRRVFPLVQLAMGYPAEDPPTRPRYPLEFCLFEERYPEFSEEMIQAGMRQMDEGYLAQEYYRKAGYQIELEDDRKETFDFNTYSWTEHISRKVGQWLRLPEEILEQLEACGFHVGQMTDFEQSE